MEEENNNEDNNLKDKNLSKKCHNFLNLIRTIGELDYSGDLALEILIDIVKILRYLGKESFLKFFPFIFFFFFLINFPLVYENEFFESFKFKILDKLIKKLDEKDIFTHEIKVELALIIMELFDSTLLHLLDQKDNLKTHFTVIDKIYGIPRKFAEKPTKYMKEFRYLKYKILNSLFRIFKEISLTGEGKSSSKETRENIERMNYYLVKKF